jgi:tetratricopeptide (TPR) repeat protein
MRFAPVHVTIFLVIGCMCVPLCAQENDTALKLRLAQSLEQAGELDRAVELYEGLYRSDPNNYVYFDGLRRVYTQQRKYESAITLIEDRLKSQPSDVGLRASLGGVYYESGSERSADSIWNGIIRIDPKNVGLYRLVAAQMMEHRLYEQAVKIYLEGRRASGNTGVFVDELGTMYTVLQEYNAASAEYITMLKSSPQQLPFVQSRIGAFTVRNEGLRAATEVTREEVRNSPENITVRKLYAWLAMEGRDYQTALEEYRTIEKLSGSSGTELLNFANRASQDGKYLVASEAFHDVIGLSRVPTFVSQARFGYARSVEELSAQADSSGTQVAPQPSPTGNFQLGMASETEQSFRNVLQLYEAIIKDYPNSDFDAQSYYRMGVIRMNRFFDFDGAIDAFTHARKTAQRIELACEASLKIGEVYVAKNDLEAAARAYQALKLIPLPNYQQRALYYLAELDYFGGKLDSALAKLKPLTGNLDSDLANDVLMLQYFIVENNTTDPIALVAYARADLLMRQRRYSESLAMFDDVVKRFPAALLVDDATMKIGELLLLLKQPVDAITTFRHIVNDMPESILRDHAQMKIAETYQLTLRDSDKAIEAYEYILAKFPHSLYVEEARKRIRQLRGDST